MDLDETLLRPLPECDVILGKAKVPKGQVLNNNVLKLPSELYSHLTEYSISEFHRCVCDGLTGARLFINSVSAAMVGRFVRQHSLRSSIDYDDYFETDHAQSWVQLMD